MSMNYETCSETGLIDSLSSVSRYISSLSPDGVALSRGLLEAVSALSHDVLSVHEATFRRVRGGQNSVCQKCRGSGIYTKDVSWLLCDACSGARFQKSEFVAAYIAGHDQPLIWLGSVDQSTGLNSGSVELRSLHGRPVFESKGEVIVVPSFDELMRGLAGMFEFLLPVVMARGSRSRTITSVAHYVLDLCGVFDIGCGSSVCPARLIRTDRYCCRGCDCQIGAKPNVSNESMITWLLYDTAVGNRRFGDRYRTDERLKSLAHEKKLLFTY